MRSDILTPAFNKQYPDVGVLVKAANQGQVPKVVDYTAIAENANSPWVTAFQKIVFSGADAKTALQKPTRLRIPYRPGLQVRGRLGGRPALPVDPSLMLTSQCWPPLG